MTARPAFPSPDASGAASPRLHSRFRVLRRAALALGAAVLGYGAFAIAFPARTPAAIGDVVADWTGANPHPVVLQRPAAQPLSAVAQLGRALFFDPALSASGKQSCASCHSPDHAYGPPNGLDVQPGGLTLAQHGYRPPPSLMYLYRQPNFSIGPDAGENDDAPTIAQQAASAAGVVKAQKVAGTSAAPQLVPQGGLFWDGRADTLQQQAFGPLLNPVEMANASVDDVARKLAQSPHRARFEQLFGPRVFSTPQLAVSEAMFAIARYQVEDPSFHPYNSKYDRWLEGRARLTQAELRGLRLFNDPNKANCAGCHLSKPGADGLPPMFTDYQYEALGVPRNRLLAQNRNPAFYDLGVCGPFRDDLKDQTQYCGMFLTPTLRNAATRHVFFHNGVFHTLDQVMAFYNERSIAPQKFYPRGPDGKVDEYDDIPPKYRANVDVKDAPFDRKPGDTPAMTAQDIEDIEAFLGTLTDEPAH
ncbi:cytochrome-c peroxidase [Burkholderia dolosa]|uniref:Cytochrome-c peroxidase n=1 Tax=Burkholderia dolosa TaxID=152500 RepID=A0A892IFG5_9BURK|nr:MULTISPECIES: cytochrome c peroxidase [Burkholderia]AKE06988.1 cytochrome C peroxidase [Burkholderia cepacia]AJY10809.1 cytochrome c family protein [Burkholderia dolosa AU0158]AYZ95305.1 cytochrome-c peroxidase [Burkholderia dolosa]ETP62488.1 cytochrome C peroxidase [Burkholderia dolosa PC543]MBR8419629.1 cytochrome-c peroxidase [Burkholderia dolosa]